MNYIYSKVCFDNMDKVSSCRDRYEFTRSSWQYLTSPTTCPLQHQLNTFLKLIYLIHRKHLFIQNFVPLFKRQSSSLTLVYVYKRRRWFMDATFFFFNVFQVNVYKCQYAKKSYRDHFFPHLNSCLPAIGFNNYDIKSFSVWSLVTVWRSNLMKSLGLVLRIKGFEEMTLYSSERTSCAVLNTDEGIFYFL